MNAAHTPQQPHTDTADSALSALVDGELLPQDIDEVLASLDEDGTGHERWSRYQLIGDVLRGDVAARGARSSQEFLAGFRTQLQKAAPPSREWTDVAAVVATGVDRSAAVNDAVFRWKMVAGMASLAAVMAVSWTLLGSAPGVHTEPGSDPQLALADKPAAAPSTQAGTVVVETQQGPVLRDPQLEALMAQHRQHGGASALQMPTGFLRNATYDAPAR